MSLSGGYTPDEDTIDWTDSDSSEDSTTDVSSCCYFFLVQESWVTERSRLPMGWREQIYDNSEQLCELPIVQVVEDYLGSRYVDSPASPDPHGDPQRMVKYPQERGNQNFWKLEGLMRYLDAYREDLKGDEDEYQDKHDDHDKHGARADADDDNNDDDNNDDDGDGDNDDDDQTFSDSALDEDLEASTSTSPQLDQLTCQERGARQAWPWWKLPDTEDIIPLPEISPRRGDELIEMISQERDTEDTRSVSSGQSTEGSHSGTTSCLNVRSIVQWFRKRMVSSLRRRRRPDLAYKDPDVLEPKKHCFLRGQRIQPQ
ncbi:uncharacterized protein C12orf71 homolog [Callospermophilus lateralis]|uniref:uncharacterized protein C12orf71 homolog n=1 Tax=Callospermophilus lateralis TaxID=76772 RepID=UPI0040537C11